MYWHRSCICSTHCPIFNILVVWHSLPELYLLLSVISRTWRNTCLSDATQWPIPELVQAGTWRHLPSAGQNPSCRQRGPRPWLCNSLHGLGPCSSITQSTPACGSASTDHSPCPVRWYGQGTSFGATGEKRLARWILALLLYLFWHILLINMTQPLCLDPCYDLPACLSDFSSSASWFSEILGSHLAQFPDLRWNRLKFKQCKWETKDNLKRCQVLKTEYYMQDKQRRKKLLKSLKTIIWN